MFYLLSIAEHFQFVFLLESSSRSGAVPSGVCGGNDVSDTLFKTTDKVDRIFNGVMTAAEANSNGLLEMFHELQTKIRVVHSKVAAGLSKAAKMAESCIKRSGKVNDTHLELCKA